MEEILLFIVLGLGSGALIAGISLGVVLTYRGSGVINLSVGAFAMLGGYAFWALTSGKIASLPTAAALRRLASNWLCVENKTSCPCRAAACPSACAR